MRQRYYHEEVGWNSRLDSLQAAVLEVKLQLSAGVESAAAGSGRELRQALSGCRAGCGRDTGEGVVLPFTDPRAGHVFHQYVIRAPRRDALRQYLTERQIGSEIYYPLPLHLQTSLAGLGLQTGRLPCQRERRRLRCWRCRCIRSFVRMSRQTVVDAIAASMREV